MGKGNTSEWSGLRTCHSKGAFQEGGPFFYRKLII